MSATFIASIFDKSGKPLLTAVRRATKVKFYTFYFPKTKKKVKEIWKDMERLGSLFSGGPVFVNDFKKHILAFNLRLRTDYDIYELNAGDVSFREDIGEAKKELLKLLIDVKETKAEKWRRLLANANVVYQFLENRKLKDNYLQIRPIFDTKTFTGRSRTTEFNIQGTTSKHDIRPVLSHQKVFIHFDWVSADMRVASFLSNDQRMENAFLQSDPYEQIVRDLVKYDPSILDEKDEDELRKECKIDLLKSLYSLSTNRPVLDYYCELKEWMREKVEEIKRNGFSCSLLGRKYDLLDNLRTVFNAQIQGTVAHAMQACIIELHSKCPDNFLIEIHDSVVLTCCKSEVMYLIKMVTEIMNNPLRDWHDDPPRFPIEVSIGQSWKNWTKYKTFR